MSFKMLLSGHIKNVASGLRGLIFILIEKRVPAEAHRCRPLLPCTHVPVPALNEGLTAD